jgi:mannose-6-phosphate isomerase-like protein (cupin superfamily)
MINLLLKKNNTNNFTSHSQTSEYYLNVYGQLKIEYYLNKTKKNIILKKNDIFIMPNKVLHRTISNSNYCIFLEVREGRFLKNDTFTSKIL